MTEAELTILSLVAEGARYGHEIQQLIDERGLREWLTVGFSSIYYILNKLEQQNLVSSELRSEGRTPARKVYRMTEAGRGVLQTAVSDLLRQPRSIGNGFELGLANMYVLKPRQVYKVLSDHQQDLEQRLQAIEQSWQAHQRDDEADVAQHISALYTHSIALMQAELDWLTQFVEDWVARYPAVREPDERNGTEEVPQHRAKTAFHKRTPPEPAKLIQKLRRPGASTEE